MEPTPIEIVASSCFFGALIHAFSASKIESLARRTRDKTISALLHFAGEIEIVFGLWAAAFVTYMIFHQGFEPTLSKLQEKSFNEPIFVFVIMVIAATRPILDFSRSIVVSLSKLLNRSFKIPTLTATYAITLILTPLLGSLITEPAAMTVGALLLKDAILDHYDEDQSGGRRLLYSTIAALFVNISIGGTLTSFAAPPVLMVARIWEWDTSFMLSHFGWKASIAVTLNTLFCVFLNFKILRELKINSHHHEKAAPSPLWIRGTHLGFLLLAIVSAHYPAFLIASFLFFMGFTQATNHAQSELKIREALLVSFFLGGLVVLTAEQSWWLKPILTSLSDTALFLSATALTAITDNAAITSLAAQVPDLALSSKYAVLEGAVVGGGLTLIANAPNPAGYAILRDRFKEGGINALTLFAYALIPTLIAGACLWIL